MQRIEMVRISLKDCKIVLFGFIKPACAMQSDSLFKGAGCGLWLVFARLQVRLDEKGRIIKRSIMRLSSQRC